MRLVRKLSFFLILTSFTAPLFPSPLGAALSTRAEMPEFLGATAWVNTETVPTKKSLAGKVVLIDFWSPSNLRNLRRIGILKEWYYRYHYEGLEIIGVVSPEFEFEKDKERMARTIKKMKIEYPVALDAGNRLGLAFNYTGPMQTILIDGDGRIYKIFREEMDYSAAETELQEVLKRANPHAAMPEEKVVNTPTYRVPLEFVFGYKKLSGYGNDIRLNAASRQSFTLPQDLNPDKFYLSGAWIPKEDNLTTPKLPAMMTSKFSARSMFLVAGSQTGSPLPVEILLDGSPVDKKRKGKDMVFQAGKSYVFIDDYRIYEVLKFPERQSEQKLELRFEEPGAEIFKMTFE